MDEHGAATAGYPGPGVVVDLDDEVVEVVVAPEAIAWFIGRAAERPIVAPICRVLAPGIGAPDRSTGSKCAVVADDPPETTAAPYEIVPAEWRRRLRACRP